MDARPIVPGSAHGAEASTMIGGSRLGCRAMSAKPWAGRRLHFVGIGGAGMSGLALVARELGAEVSGSDRAPDSPYLRAAGIAAAAGHDAANVPAGAEVVFSTAIPPDNPERLAAGGRELHRAALLGELTRLKPTIAVTGTHGKTTTASMIVHALRGCGMDPAYLVGGEVRSTGANAGWGTGEWLVVEADESDRSLLELAPRIAALTNAELDHHATYSSQRDVDETFAAFLALAHEVVVGDEPGLGRFLVPADEVVLGEDVAPARESGLLRFRGSVARAEDVRLEPGGSRFVVDGVPVTLRVPGVHNARNAAVALGASRAAGADLRQAAAALADFSGARRRFERLGTTAAGAIVIDDYAHHPTEVRATIAAARTQGPRRIVAVFQPHLFSRTRHQHREFGAALALADLAVVLDIYPAREAAADYPGVTGRLVAAAAADRGDGRTVAWLPGFDEAERFLRAELRDGDLLLTLGAGNVDALGRRLLA
jgi:UDP-N-acetylmuramate--alanine ligase